MSTIKSFFMAYWYYFVMTILLIFSSISVYLCIYYYNKCNDIDKINVATNIETFDNNKNNETLNDECNVDIKGFVKNPGVYTVSCKDTIKDIIETSGGLKKDANTNNINLAKRVKDEMVIYIYSSTEIKQKSKNDIKQLSCNTETVYIDTCVSQKASIIESGSEGVDSQHIVEKDGNINTYKKNKDSEVLISSQSLIEQENTESKSKVSQTKISINTATKDELMKLSGVGESKALSIIKYREENGYFKNIEDIKNVSGIGDAMFENIKDFITV